MAFKVKLPKFLSSKKNQASQADPQPTVIDLFDTTAKTTSPSKNMLTVSRSPIKKQVQVFAAILIFVLLVIVAIAYKNNSDSTVNAAYIATSGDMGMLSQRLSRATSLAMRGETTAFKQLRESHTKFASELEILRNGGELRGVSVPSSLDTAGTELEALQKLWAKTSQNATYFLGMEKNLITFAEQSASIDENNATLLDLAEQIATKKLQSTTPNVREIAAAQQLVMLSQRTGKNIYALRATDEIRPEVSFQLGKDTDTFRELLNALTKGNEALLLNATSDPETQLKLAELDAAFKVYESAAKNILSIMTDVVNAKLAGAAILHEGEPLLEATNRLAQVYQGNDAGRIIYIAGLAGLVLLAIALLALMARAYLNDSRAYLDDSRRQTELAEKNRSISEALNKQNQNAILRLLNELGELADGDLTVSATVSEEITGAIADSINYTVEELRVLVGRINDAANRVTQATGTAQEISTGLLEAAKRQSVVIQETGHSVLTVARSMTQVSGEADQSAKVARRSLSAAEKGAQAVQDSIKGMNEIRSHIQETSKRIKRLGESSQEIGEIVELISDITEQTNVLALNAAIQAASAGEAGRGFTVVAEEVQRLAERSGEATKQIASIVQTIQTDTQGAVAAMEDSTRGVVEGAKLSDAAGQALTEIGEVSKNLSSLIESISSATRKQAASATGVAGKMQDILRVTEQTTVGTQKTATSIGELSALAVELKGSVAGFKVD